MIQDCWDFWKFWHCFFNFMNKYNSKMLFSKFLRILIFSRIPKFSWIMKYFSRLKIISDPIWSDLFQYCLERIFFLGSLFLLKIKVISDALLFLHFSILIIFKVKYRNREIVWKWENNLPVKDFLITVNHQMARIPKPKFVDALVPFPNSLFD